MKRNKSDIEENGKDEHGSPFYFGVTMSLGGLIVSLPTG